MKVHIEESTFGVLPCLKLFQLNSIPFRRFKMPKFNFILIILFLYNHQLILNVVAVIKIALCQNLNLSIRGTIQMKFLLFGCKRVTDIYEYEKSFFFRVLTWLRAYLTKEQRSEKVSKEMVGPRRVQEKDKRSIMFAQLYNTINIIGPSFRFEAMLDLKLLNRNVCSTYSKSLSNLHQAETYQLELREFWPRKSIFDPPDGLAESYAARNNIQGAEVPTIQVLHSSRRWLLLQAPRYSLSFFKRINSGLMANAFEALLRVFKSFCALGKIYGYFLVSQNMIFYHKKEICVWINADIFSNYPTEPVEAGQQSEKIFVSSFLQMCEEQIKEWEKVTNINTIEETIRLLEWQSQLRRGSLTAVQASRQVFFKPNQSNTSFEPNELQFYSNKVKGCQSVQFINLAAESMCFQDMSNSVTVKEQQKNLIQKKIDQRLLYDSKSMKYSIYDEIKSPDQPQEVRKTKKKFNLTSTSSTLEKFSDHLVTMIGKRSPKIKYIDKSEDEENLKGKKLNYPRFESNLNAMHRSEPPSIATELDDLFADDEMQQFRFGEGNIEQLEKIAEEMQQILIW